MRVFRLRWKQPLIILAVWTTIFTGRVSLQSAPPEEVVAKGAARSPWVVFIVPGTFGNASNWFHAIPDKASFASELKENLGPQTVLHSFIWRSDTAHDVRVKAATNLAAQIEERTKPNDRILLVGHSHGGNVALLAASLCRDRKIDTVVCLATPHIYYLMKKADEPEDQPVHCLPVYCTADGRKNIDKILTLTASTDDVPDFYADLAKGVDENDALHAVRGWTDAIKNLSLKSDGGPLTNVFANVFGLWYERHIRVSRDLNAANYNILYRCEVPSQRGGGAHQTVHSRRMGAILGQTVGKGLDKQSIQYLKSLTQPPGRDTGEPIAITEFRAEEARQEMSGNRMLSGWLLDSVLITSTCEIDRQTKFFGQDPDPFFRITNETGRTIYESSSNNDTNLGRWKVANLLMPRTATWQFSVYESNTLLNELLGTELLSTATDTPPQTFTGNNWSAALKWKPVHE